MGSQSEPDAALTRRPQGWIIWRTPDHLPKELIFELHYLGETDYSFNLNFSRPAHPILSQMFNCEWCPELKHH